MQLSMENTTFKVYENISHNYRASTRICNFWFSSSANRRYIPPPPSQINFHVCAVSNVSHTIMQTYAHFNSTSESKKQLNETEITTISSRYSEI
jgi:hypothetical protein